MGKICYLSSLLPLSVLRPLLCWYSCLHSFIRLFVHMFYWDSISLCTSSRPETVDKAGIWAQEIHLLLPHRSWDIKGVLPYVRPPSFIWLHSWSLLKLRVAKLHCLWFPLAGTLSCHVCPHCSTWAVRVLFSTGTYNSVTASFLIVLLLW